MQDLVFLGRQLDHALAHADLAPTEVDVQLADLHRTLIGRTGGGCATGYGANAGQQLAVAERFGDVSVVAKVESPDPVSFFAARGQQDDWPRSAFTQLATDVEAAQPGQHDVEHDQVRQRPLGQRQGLFATVRQDRPVAFLAQRVADNVGNIAIVVDHENVHSSSLARGSSTTNRAPCGTLSSTRTDPPCRSTSDFTMARPKPLPASPRRCAPRPGYTLRKPIRPPARG